MTRYLVLSLAYLVLGALPEASLAQLGESASDKPPPSPLQRFDAANQSGKYLEAYTLGKLLCGPELESVEKSKTKAGSEESGQTLLKARKTAIAAALKCLRDKRAASYVSTDPFNRMVVTELFKSDLEALEKADEEATAGLNFMGIKFGVGLGFSVGSSKAIDNAVVVNGVIRATSSQKQQPRVVFEFHKYLWCGKNAPGLRGCGPFVAVASSDSKVLSGVGLGFMYGWRDVSTSTDGFSIGIGAMLDAKVKDLASGFEEDHLLPAGETEVRYHEKSRWSLIIFATKTF